MARTSTNAVTKRPRKTAAEKAQADYDAAVKTRDAAERKLAKLQEGVAPAQEAFNAAERRVAYLAQNPDLPEQPAAVAGSDGELASGGEPAAEETNAAE